VSLCGLEMLLCPRTVLGKGLAERVRLASSRPARGRGSPRRLCATLAVCSGARAGVQSTPRAPGEGASPRLSALRRSPRGHVRVRYRPLPWVSREASGAPALLRYPWRNLVIANTVSRFSMSWTARASLWARMVKAFPFSCAFSKRATSFCPGSLCRRNSTAASETAHLRYAWPIFLPEVPDRLPADSLAQLTRRHYEAQSCTLGRRRMSWIS
jgi:hypothetical protein